MILLSAGHNPKQQGACNGDYCEYPVASLWVKRLVEILGDSAPVEMVPTGSLTSKVNFINSKDAVVAAEIHFNSNVRAKGSETLYAPGSEKGKELALAIQEQFKARGIFQPDRGAKEGWYRLDRPKVIDYKGDVEGDEVINYFLRATYCPSVIVEPEFISNRETIDKWFFEGCDAIAQALLDFYKKYKT